MRRHMTCWLPPCRRCFALCLAAPAEAAKEGKKKPAAAAHSMKHRHAAVAAAPGLRYQGGVPAGPLYNGQDYLGDDPDPNIRSHDRDVGDYGGRLRRGRSARRDRPGAAPVDGGRGPAANRANKSPGRRKPPC